MGLRAEVLKSKYGQSKSDEVTVVNAEGPFDPTDDAPAVLLVEGNLPGTVIAVPAIAIDGVATDDGCGYGRFCFEGQVGPMMNGNFIHTPDSRFREKVENVLNRYNRPGDKSQRFYGAIALHDRFETQVQYDRLSAD